MCIFEEDLCKTTWPRLYGYNSFPLLNTDLKETSLCQTPFSLGMLECAHQGLPHPKPCIHKHTASLSKEDGGEK